MGLDETARHVTDQGVQHPTGKPRVPSILPGWGASSTKHSGTSCSWTGAFTRSKMRRCRTTSSEGQVRTISSQLPASSSENQSFWTSALLVMPHFTYSCHPTAFIEAMYVRDEHRRRGVARMMVERLLDDARSAGCRKVQLLTH